MTRWRCWAASFTSDQIMRPGLDINWLAHTCAGEMNDASEVLRALYEALENQGQGTLVNNCFGLEVMEVRYHVQIRRPPCHEKQFT